MTDLEYIREYIKAQKRVRALIQKQLQAKLITVHKVQFEDCRESFSFYDQINLIASIQFNLGVLIGGEIQKGNYDNIK